MIALSFDVEEFDLPAEHGVRLKELTQLEVSCEGLQAVLDLLGGMGVKATFFCTAFFAERRPHLVQRIVHEGHELASHAFHHSDFKIEDLAISRDVLQKISGQSIVGYRAPRMAEVSMEQLRQAGYLWDSSLNPCFVPGRYNNFGKPRTPFMDDGVVEIPASVSPWVRVPLFWLAAHNLPFDIYKLLCDSALRKDGLLNIYFHPWEFSSALHISGYRVPFYIRRNSGETLLRRLARLIEHYKRRGESFVTLSNVAAQFAHTATK